MQSRLPMSHRQLWPNRHQSLLSHHQSLPSHHQLLPNHRQLPPNHRQLPPNHRQLPPNHHQLPPNHRQLSPNHHQLSPNHHQLSPNHHQCRLAKCIYQLGTPAHLSNRCTLRHRGRTTRGCLLRRIAPTHCNIPNSLRYCSGAPSNRTTEMKAVFQK
jgi:hypothetical protein